MKTKEQNLTQAGAVLLLSAVIVKLIGAFFKIPLSADYALGDLGFGYFSTVYDLYTPIYTLALSGFPVAIAKIIADFMSKKDWESERKIFILSYKFLLLIGSIVAFAFCGISLPFIVFGSRENWAYSLLAIAPAILFCCISSVYRGYFEGHKNMLPTAISNIIEALGKLILGLGGAVLVMRITGNPAMSSAAALVGIAVGTLLSCVYLRVSFKRNSNFKGCFKLKEKAYNKALLRSLVTFLIPVAIASLSVGITAFIDTLTVRPMLQYAIEQNPDNAALLLKKTLYNIVSNDKIPILLYGVKGKAYTLFNLVPTLTTALGIGVVPLAAECFAKKDIKALRYNTNLCLKLSSVLSLPIAFGFIWIGEGITDLLYGVKSAQLGGELLAVYGVAAFFAGLSIPTTALLQAAAKQKAALVNITFGLCLKLICNLIFIAFPQINICGAAIGTAVGFTVIFVLNMVSIIKSFGFLPDVSNCFLKPIIAAFVCGFTAFIIQIFNNSKLGTIISIAVAGMVYIILLWILKVIKKEEILEFINK